MTTPTRECLHQLVDAIPDSELPAAEQALTDLSDPVLRAFAAAPEDDESLTPEEAAALAEGEADLAAGRAETLDAFRTRMRASSAV